MIVRFRRPRLQSRKRDLLAINGQSVSDARVATRQAFLGQSALPPNASTMHHLLHFYSADLRLLALAHLNLRNCRL